MHGYGYCIEPGWQAPVSADVVPPKVRKTSRHSPLNNETRVRAAAIWTLAVAFVLNVMLSLSILVQHGEIGQFWHAPFR